MAEESYKHFGGTYCLYLQGMKCYINILPFTGQKRPPNIAEKHVAMFRLLYTFLCAIHLEQGMMASLRSARVSNTAEK
jgi:hypothetical protein